MSNYYRSFAEFIGNIEKQISELGISLVRESDTPIWNYSKDGVKRVSLAVCVGSGKYLGYVVETYEPNEETNEYTEGIVYETDEQSNAILRVIREITKANLA